jgi:hypothetical protein
MNTTCGFCSSRTRLRPRGDVYVRHANASGDTCAASGRSARTVRVRRTPISELRPGDQFIRPGFSSVYTEDRDGWTSLSPLCGTRFEVVAYDADTLTAKRLSDGRRISQRGAGSQTVPKIILKPEPKEATP